MSRWSPIAVSGLGSALLLMIVIEINQAVPWFDPPGPYAPATPDAGQQVPHDTAPVPQPFADSSAILARPLFNWNRRPGQSSGITATDAPLPRLAGILVRASQRYAIFAAPPGGKPQVVQEGNTIGHFTVDKITGDHIILKDGSNLQTLHTTFAAPQPPAMATPDAS